MKLCSTVPIKKKFHEIAAWCLISNKKHSRVLCYTCNHEDVPKHSLFYDAVSAEWTAAPYFLVRKWLYIILPFNYHYKFFHSVIFSSLSITIINYFTLSSSHSSEETLTRKVKLVTLVPDNSPIQK